VPEQVTANPGSRLPGHAAESQSPGQDLGGFLLARTTRPSSSLP